MRRSTLTFFSIVGTLSLFSLCRIGEKSFTPATAHAQTVTELQQKIDQRNTDIQNLEKDIAGYQKQIDALGTTATSLSSTIKSLELNQKKLEADIKLTEAKISSKNIEIQRLSSQISDKVQTIGDDRRIITHSFSTMNQLDRSTLIEMLLASQSLSDAWNSFENLTTIQGELFSRINSLQQVKTTLETSRKSSEKAKDELVKLKNQLGDQRKVVLSTSAEKAELLKQTKLSESSYKNILAEKKALQDSFQKEIDAYESQLHLLIDPSKLAHTGKGILQWPLDNPLITQYFGNTPFATANAQIYNGKGHTGIDLRASIGTPIKSAGGGIVVGVGNTDLIRKCVSYGKWVMVKHPNGLSTLYAHLSLQNVVKGQMVTAGQLLGYSGNTGYTTGPHLHFGVYATEGVQITTLTNSKNCTGATLPLADYKAYLNPLSYL